MLQSRALPVSAHTGPSASHVTAYPAALSQLLARPSASLLQLSGPCVPAFASSSCRFNSRRNVAANAGKGGGKKGRGQGSSAVLDEEQPQPMAIIEDKELHEEASESYLAYAMSVIVGRALPDVRDGLKPVHRRILYAMHELGLSANKPFKKCARVVGEVLGKYHPHGDTAVYDALVRMAQDFSLRHPLVSGHGNFGSLDNDPPAAMRYTECRLQALTADMLLSDLDQGVVDFIPTFDASQDEPVVLPAKVPNLLINGTQGIAVGIATKIPPHNMLEVVEGLAALIHNPDITVAELRNLIPAPDFPTGNVVVVGQGAEAMYETGNGHVILRATIVTETDAIGGTSSKQRRHHGGGTRLVITDVPYQTSKAELVESIAKLVEDKTLEGVADVRDESDRTGTRVVVEVKSGASPEAIQASLYRNTRLQIRFATNMVALVEGAPKHLNLKQCLEHFLEFRVAVIERRARHQMAAAEKRLQLVEGFLKAIQMMDDVLQIIRESDDTASARATLMRMHNLNTEQADAVLGLPLRRFNRMEATELKREHEELVSKIDALNQLLNDYQAVLDVVEAEAREVANKYGTPRKSVIVEEEGMLDGSGGGSGATPAQPVLVFASSKGFLHRVTQQQDPEVKAKAKPSLGVRSGDGLEHVVVADAAQQLLLVTHEGRAYRLPASAVPELSSGRNSNSASPAQLLNAQSSISIAAIMPLVTGRAEANTNPHPTASTADVHNEHVDHSDHTETADHNGHISHSSHSAGADSASRAVGSGSGGGDGHEGDAGGEHVGEGEGTWNGPCLVVVTQQGMIKRTPLVPSFNKITKLGVPVIKMKKGDRVVWAGVAQPGDSIALARNDGRLLQFSLDEVRPVARAAAGIQGVRVADDQVVAGAAVIPSSVTGSQSSSLLLVSERGRGKRVPLSEVKQGGRGQVGLVALSVVSARKPDSIIALHFVHGQQPHNGHSSDASAPLGELVLSTSDGAVTRLPLADVPEIDFSASGAMLLPTTKQSDAQTVSHACVVPWSNAA